MPAPHSPTNEPINNQSAGLTNHKPQYILNMCIGSGCIAIACVYASLEAEIDAVGISPNVLTVAEHNVESHDLIHHTAPIRSDLFHGLPRLRYDLIVTSPPHVSGEDIADLPEEYEHGPVLNLASGGGDLRLTRRIPNNTPDYLNNDGILIYGVGSGMVHLTE